MSNSFKSQSIQHSDVSFVSFQTNPVPVPGGELQLQHPSDDLHPPLLPHLGPPQHSQGKKGGRNIHYEYDFLLLSNRCHRNKILLKFLEAKYEYYDYLDGNNITQTTLIYNVTSLRWGFWNLKIKNFDFILILVAQFKLEMASKII